MNTSYEISECASSSRPTSSHTGPRNTSKPGKKVCRTDATKVSGTTLVPLVTTSCESEHQHLDAKGSPSSETASRSISRLPIAGKSTECSPSTGPKTKPSSEVVVNRQDNNKSPKVARPKKRAGKQVKKPLWIAVEQGKQTSPEPTSGRPQPVRGEHKQRGAALNAGKMAQSLVGKPVQAIRPSSKTDSAQCVFCQTPILYSARFHEQNGWGPPRRCTACKQKGNSESEQHAMREIRAKEMRGELDGLTEKLEEARAALEEKSPSTPESPPAIPFTRPKRLNVSPSSNSATPICSTSPSETPSSRHSEVGESSGDAPAPSVGIEWGKKRLARHQAPDYVVLDLKPQYVTEFVKHDEDQNPYIVLLHPSTTVGGVHSNNPQSKHKNRDARMLRDWNAMMTRFFGREQSLEQRLGGARVSYILCPDELFSRVVFVLQRTHVTLPAKSNNVTMEDVLRIRAGLAQTEVLHFFNVRVGGHKKNVKYDFPENCPMIRSREHCLAELASALAWYAMHTACLEASNIAVAHQSSLSHSGQTILDNTKRSAFSWWSILVLGRIYLQDTLTTVASAAYAGYKRLRGPPPPFTNTRRVKPKIDCLTPRSMANALVGDLTRFGCEKCALLVCACETLFGQSNTSTRTLPRFSVGAAITSVLSRSEGVANTKKGLFASVSGTSRCDLGLKTRASWNGIQKALKPYGRVVDNPGNGNCLFFALVDALGIEREGVEPMRSHLLSNVVDQVSDGKIHPDQILNEYPEFKDMQDFKEGMSVPDEDGVWPSAGLVFLKAWSDTNRKNVIYLKVENNQPPGLNRGAFHTACLGAVLSRYSRRKEEDRFLTAYAVSDEFPIRENTPVIIHHAHHWCAFKAERIPVESGELRGAGRITGLDLDNDMHRAPFAWPDLKPGGVAGTTALLLGKAVRMFAEAGMGLCRRPTEDNGWVMGKGTPHAQNVSGAFGVAPTYPGITTEAPMPQDAFIVSETGEHVAPNAAAFMDAECASTFRPSLNGMWWEKNKNRCALNDSETFDFVRTTHHRFSHVGIANINTMPLAFDNNWVNLLQGISRHYNNPNRNSCKNEVHKKLDPRTRPLCTSAACPNCPGWLDVHKFSLDVVDQMMSSAQEYAEKMKTACPPKFKDPLPNVYVRAMLKGERLMESQGLAGEQCAIEVDFNLESLLRWYTSLDARRRRLYGGGVQDLLDGVFLRDDIFDMTAFLKWEKKAACFESEPDVRDALPRLVCPSKQPKLNLLTGPIFKFLAKTLTFKFREWLADITKPLPLVSVTSGSNAKDIGAWKTAMHLEGYYIFIEVDFSRLDSTHNEGFAWMADRTLMIALEQLRFQSEEEWTMWLKARDRDVVLPCGRFTYKNGLCSGWGGTFHKNTSGCARVVIASWRCVCARNGIASDCKMLALGDDGLLGVKGVSRETVSGMVKELTSFIKNLGLKPKIHCTLASQYCSSKFWPIVINGVETLILAPEIIRCFSRIGFVFTAKPDHKLYTHDECASLMKGIVESNAHWVALPIFRVLHKYYISYEGKGVRQQNEPHQMVLTESKDTVYTISDRVAMFLQLNYDLDPVEVLAFEGRLQGLLEQSGYGPCFISDRALWRAAQHYDTVTRATH